KQGGFTEELTEELRKQVKSQLETGAIRPSNSEWSSRPHMVMKKTGEWRVVFDYRKVNQQMIPDNYPIPNVSTLLQRAAGYGIYTCLDLNWGFWNVPIAESSKKYTAFVSPFGLYEYNVIPFGVKNSPGEFQRAMDKVLARFQGTNVL